MTETPKKTNVEKPSAAKPAEPKTDAAKPGEAESQDAGAPGATSAMPFRVHAQYLHDLSFENPGAHEAFKRQSGSASGEALQFSIHWHITNQALEAAAPIYQAETRVTVSGHYGGERDEKTACFMLEISMMAVAEIATNISDKQVHQQILRIEIPHLVYPYLRHQIDRVLQDGGYPLLNLPPLNFAEAYRQYLQQADAAKSS